MSLGYRPALDGLRGVAIAAVVLFHTGGLVPAGYLGVDLFFVLSGFLITTLLLSEHGGLGGVSLRAFYRRRAARLLPGLYCLLAVFTGGAILLALRGEVALGDELFGVVAGLAYFANLALMGEPASQSMPEELRHLWSLAAEEQFYLLWPPALLIVLRGGVRLAAALVAAGAALMALRALDLYLEGASFERLAFGVDTRSVSILLGCLLALALAARPDVPSLYGRRLEVPALAALVGLFLVDFGRLTFAGPLLVFALASAVVVARALDSSSALATALSGRGLVFLGRISYSLYLWHVPVFVVLGVGKQELEPRAVPAVALSLALAVASYYLVELRFLAWRRAAADRPGEPPRATPALVLAREST